MKLILMRYWQLQVITFFLLLAAHPAIAEVQPDASLEVNSQVKIQENIQLIEGGTRAGNNLFHSFAEFSVPNNVTVYFNNAVDLQNIFARITGKSPSLIDGTLKANGSANLFLLNPNGITFGANAKLNIGGSFVATTANAIGFGEQGFFSANTPNNPSLLTINPSSFLYNQLATQPLINQSIARNSIDNLEIDGLRVPDGRSLLLVGGNVQLNGGTLKAPGGRVELGGLTALGSIGLSINNQNLSLSFPQAVELADVSLDNNAEVNVRAVGGGSIAINANNLDLVSGSKIRAGISGNGLPNSQAGDIEIKATKTVRLNQESLISNVVLAQTIGNGGNVNITANALAVKNGAQVIASTFAQGNAGNVNINVQGAMSFDGSSSNGQFSAAYSSVETGAVGNGGEINLTGRSLSVTNGAFLNTSTKAQGNAGSVKVNVQDSVTLAALSDELPVISSSVDRLAVGNAGNLNIKASNLSLSNFTAIAAANNGGQGNAGNVDIAVNNFSSSNGIIRTFVARRGIGNAGNISVKANSIVTDGGDFFDSSNLGEGNSGQVLIEADLIKMTAPIIRSASAGFGESDSVNIQGQSILINGGNNGNGLILSQTYGASTSNDINIQGESVSIFDTRLSTQSIGTGTARSGDINVTAQSTLLSGSTLSTFSSGLADSGNINIKSADLNLINGAQLISSGRGTGNAGSIQINAGKTINISGVTSTNTPSGLFTRTSSDAKGGNITINTDNFHLSDGAILDTRTQGKGNGGNISVNANNFAIANGGQLIAITEGSGRAGNIAIKASNQANLSGSDPTYKQRLAKFGDSVINTSASSGLFTGTNANSTGSGGQISIDTNTLNLSNQAQLSSSTTGQGNAGKVNINATNNVALNRATISSDVKPEATGNGGDINIKTNSLSLTNRSELSASTSGQGNAGRVNINTRDRLTLNNSNILSFVGSSAIGDGGEINLKSSSLSLNNGALLNAETQGNGNAGKININANDLVTISGINPTTGESSLISTSTSTSGNGGNITLNTNNLQITDSGILDARTNANGAGGNITINANIFAATQGGQVLANTFGSGNAGDINLNILTGTQLAGSDPTFAARLAKFGQDTVKNQGNNSGLFAASESSGDAGRIRLTTDQLNVQDQAVVSVKSQQSGNAGNLEVASSSIQVDNQGSLTATSATGQGGNIKLQADNLLSLRHGSNISAFSNGSGNEGNIQLNTNLLVAMEKSSIIANAFAGPGANINIRSQGLFFSPDSRVTASGTINIEGQTNVNATADLPETVLQGQNLITQGCAATATSGNNFIVTGKGGLPLNPAEILSGERVLADLGNDNLLRQQPTQNSLQQSNNLQAAKEKHKGSLVEAQGWIINKNGQVVLTAQVPVIKPHNTWQQLVSCQ
ncbi:MAG TPA: filamentous hemagglutinin N-terminal domain-containing protein [Oculatellaceae cyanobacterium]|jgi:filamentous hemagglutinin family protein